jgi:hypothetical protein
MDDATQQPKKRGRKPGTPKTGGRIKGTPNKATAEVKSLARQYGADMIDVLAKIAMDDERPESARVSAAKELLDRGYGKSIQQISGPDEGPIPIDNRIDLSGCSPEQLRALASIKVE